MLLLSFGSFLLGLLLKVLGEADGGADGVLVPGLARVVSRRVALVALGVLFTENRRTTGGGDMFNIIDTMHLTSPPPSDRS